MTDTPERKAYDDMANHSLSQPWLNGVKPVVPESALPLADLSDSDPRWDTDHEWEVISSPIVKLG